MAVEAEQAISGSAQIKEIDERLANLYAEADPEGIVVSAPGVGPVISAVIVGRIGDPHRSTSLAAIRAYSGLVPKVSQSGLGESAAASPGPATRFCGRRCSSLPITHAWLIPSWRRSTSE